MKLFLHILTHLDPNVKSVFVTKELDNVEERVLHAMELNRLDASQWRIEQSLLLDTDIYNRLPQYTLIDVEQK